MAISYVIAQLLGAFIGYGLLLLLIPPKILELSGPSLGVLKPMELMAIPQALCIEFIATGILIWFCCSIWDPRNAKNQDSVALRFAFAIAGLVAATVRLPFSFVLLVISCVAFWFHKNSISIFLRQISLAEVRNVHMYSVNFFLSKLIKNKSNKKRLHSPIGMNPARSTGPAIWTGDFEFLWVSSGLTTNSKTLLKI